MKTKHSARSSLLVKLGALTLAAGAGWLLLDIIRRGIDAVDPTASVVGALISVTTTLTATVSIIRARSAAATAEQVDNAARTLANAMRERWTEELRIRQVRSPRIPVRWRLATSDLMDRADLLDPSGSPSYSGRADRVDGLAAWFRTLPHRRLAIIGEPGTGKTTLAVQLLLDLVSREAEDPVPILLSLAHWDLDADPTLQDRLIARIGQDVPALGQIAPDAVRALVAQSRVLPVLDGLDEVPASRRATVVAALNADPDAAMIMACRQSVYQESGPLRLAAVVVPEQLTVDDARTHLQHHLPARHHPGWAAVIAAMEPGSPLAAVCTSALGLSLVRTVYLDSGRDPAPLLEQTTDQATTLYGRLLDEFIPAAASRLPTRKRHPQPDRLRHWLTTLALEMDGEPDWIWWERPRRTFRTSRSRIAAASAGGLVIAIGTTILSAAALIPGPVALSGAWFSAMSASIAVLLATTAPLNGAALLFSMRRSRPPSSMITAFRGRGRELARLLFLHTVVVSLLVSTGVLGLVGLCGHIDASTFDAIGVAVVTIGLPIGAAAGFARFLQVPPDAVRYMSPRRSWRGDRALSLFTVAAVIVVVGGAPFTVTVATEGLTRAAVLYLLQGVWSAIPIALALRPWPLLFLALSVPAARGALPRPSQVMPMLDHCHRLGLLRTDGTSYQFHHGELQQHLVRCARNPT